MQVALRPTLDQLPPTKDPFRTMGGSRSAGPSPVEAVGQVVYREPKYQVQLQLGIIIVCPELEEPAEDPVTCLACGRVFFL